MPISTSAMLPSTKDCCAWAGTTTNVARHVLAEQQYRKALLQAEERRPDVVAFLSMHLALELSNQEKFEAAAAMFERAEAALVDAAAPALERARLDAYRSMHLANQHRNREAAVEAERTKELFQLQGYAPSSVRHDLDSGREFTAGSGLLVGTFGLSLIRGGPVSARGNAIKPAYVKGKTLLLQGRLDAAEAAFRQARALFDADFEAPRDWAVEIDVLGAQIAEARGDLAAAQRLLDSAVASERALTGSTRAGGLAFLALGRIHARRGRERISGRLRDCRRAGWQREPGRCAPLLSNRRKACRRARRQVVRGSAAGDESVGGPADRPGLRSARVRERQGQ